VPFNIKREWGAVIFKHTSGPSYYQYSGLNQFGEIVHGVFTRHTGFSEPPFHSLNVGSGTGDDDHLVIRNRQAIVECMGGLVPVFLKQVHGNTVINLNNVPGFNNVFGPGHMTGNGNTSGPCEPFTLNTRAPLEGDAMVTSIPGIMPVIQVADCQPVFLFDPKRTVVANIHSGWRGSIKNIIGHTVSCMTEAFNSAPSDIVAGIGPSLGPCCAEFKNYKTEIPEEYWGYETSRRYFDFWAISRDQLLASGVLKKHIHTGGICTRCNSEEFYSYRKEGITGRFAAVIGIKSEQGH
jgi:YfiH family protein